MKFKSNSIKVRLGSIYLFLTTINISILTINTDISILYKVLFIILMHILFAIILYKHLIFPIEHLHQRSIAINKYDFDEHSTNDDNDEISEINNFFNTMLHTIKDKVTALERNKRKMDYELQIVSDIQKAILPKCKNNDLLSFSVFHKSYNKVSGNYYDIFQLHNNKYGILLIDAQGHDVPAALITMLSKESFRQNIKYNDDPAGLLRNINTTICGIFKANFYRTISFSAFFMIIDKNKHVTFCNAGHQNPCFIRTKKKKINSIRL